MDMNLTTATKHLDPAIVFFATTGVVLGLYLANKLQGRRMLPLPPGPRRLPVLGNLFSLPVVKPWRIYREWARSYGDVIYMYLPLQPVIILNSVRAAQDLMEKRSNIYSDKMFTTLDEMTGWDWNFSILSYGPRWRDRRRLFHQYFNQHAIANYHDTQLREIRLLLQRLLKDNFSVPSARLATAAIIAGIVYGKQIRNLDDDYLRLANDSFEIVMAAKKPGAFWVDYLPFLRHIPAWVPGAASSKFATCHRPTIERLRDEAFYTVKEQISSGSQYRSIVQRILEDICQNSVDSASYLGQEIVARDATSSAFLAAVDTSLIGILFSVMAMAMHPEVQRKAQSQLDDLLRFSRLPTFEDSDALPYIHAIALEVLRWMPPAPLGLPHRVMKDDEYSGFLIPKGSLIVGNIWAMLRNPDIYPQPDKFDPDRFIRDGSLNKEMAESVAVVFGFGRRICPGRFIARETLFITIASILSVFDILPAPDNDGRPIPLTAEQTSGVLSYPENVPCVVRVRNAAAEQLVRETP